MTTTPQAPIGILPPDDQVIIRRDGRVELPLYDAGPDARFNTATIVWTAMLHQLGENPAPHWSVTGAVYEGNLCVEGRLITCGAIGDTLAEIWPELAPIAKLHLSYDDGLPMHCYANGLYWLGFADRSGRRNDQRDLAHVASHFRISQMEALALSTGLDAAAERGHNVGDRLDEWIGSQASRWRTEADLAVALLRWAPLPGSKQPRAPKGGAAS